MTAWIYMVEWEVSNSGILRTLRYATESFVFPPVPDASWGAPLYESINGATTYANMFVPGRVDDLSISSHMFAPGRTRGEISIDDGSVVLSNSDGDLDRLPRYVCDGRRVRIFRIERGDTDNFDCIWYGTAAGYDRDDKSITLKLRGFQYLLDRPMMVEKFAGTNAPPAGLEGTADDLKGKVKPFLIGKVYNVSPPCVNTSKQIYQLEGQLGELFTGYALTVKDKGVALTSGGTYASLAALEATAPAAGQFKLFPGPGGAYIRLGSTPTGQITCDVTNPGNGYAGGSFISPISPSFTTYCEAQYLLFTMLRWLGENELASPAMSVIVTDTLSNAPVAVPTNQDAGIYLDSEATYLHVFNRLLACIGASMYFNAVSNAGMLYLPVVFAQNIDYSGETLTLLEGDIIGLAPRVPADPEAGIPARQIVTQYKRNYTPMRPADLAGAVSAADVAALGEEFRKVTKDGSGPNLAAYRSAPHIVYETDLYEEAGVQSLADDVLYAQYDKEHSLAVVEIDVAQFDDFVHGVTRGYVGALYGAHTRVRVTWPRFGLSAADAHLIGYERGLETVRLTLLPDFNFFGAEEPEQ